MLNAEESGQGVLTDLHIVSARCSRLPRATEPSDGVHLLSMTCTLVSTYSRTEYHLISQWHVEVLNISLTKDTDSTTAILK